MDDLSLYLLDLVQNSIKAKAKLIKLTIDFDEMLNITIEDNGIGLSKEQLKVVDSPFFTTRTTRKVGLGLSLVKLLTEQTNDSFNIESKVNVGTTLFLSFDHKHIDMPSIGNIGELIYFISVNDQVDDFIFQYKINKLSYTYHLKEVKEVFEDDLNNYQTMNLLTEYINNQIDQMRGAK
jgi:anti-sigma regulatory factor (Ser/Thr protein kinase)